MTLNELDRQIDEVVRAGNCSGCGACCLLDAGLEMRLNTHGYARPHRVGPSGPGQVPARFDRVCPGVVVEAQRPEGSVRHAVLGSSFRSWQAWAADPEERFRGSSGGTITAIVRWLLETGQVTEAIEAAKDAAAPSRTVTVTLRTPNGVIDASGSRYAPVSNAAHAVLGRPDVAFVGKPCEVAAVRALARESGREPPLLISFFCAGTPSQTATEALVQLLRDNQTVSDVWYRGHGWPGEFSVTRADGTVATDSYDHSWGKVLGPTMQWRCKICPDGVGESADIVAADYWHADANGYPIFNEQDGVSALLARTPRGAAILERAFAERVLDGQDLDLDALSQVQPFQAERRRTLVARLIGARLAGRPVPRFRDFELVRILRGRPRQLLRIARGSYRRIKEGRADG